MHGGQALLLSGQLAARFAVLAAVTTAAAKVETEVTPVSVSFTERIVHGEGASVHSSAVQGRASTLSCSRDCVRTLL